jgi:hypothetical protein
MNTKPDGFAFISCSKGFPFGTLTAKLLASAEVAVEIRRLQRGRRGPRATGPVPTCLNGLCFKDRASVARCAAVCFAAASGVGASANMSTRALL